jgi:hypothetical protein
VYSRAADWPRLQRGPGVSLALVDDPGTDLVMKQHPDDRALIGAPAEYPLGLDAAEKGARKADVDIDI